MSPQQVPEMVAQIRSAEARRAQQNDRRKPENAHLRQLWDAKHRMAELRDWKAYANIEATIKLYKSRPETAADDAECDPARGFNPPILGIESQSPERDCFKN